jgi:hypothetical protein
MTRTCVVDQPVCVHARDFTTRLHAMCVAGREKRKPLLASQQHVHVVMEVVVQAAVFVTLHNDLK